MRILICLLLSLPLAAQDLCATISHQEREVTSDGLVRTTTYQERFQRVSNHLWLTRLLPPHRPASEHEAHGREIDLSIAGRHLEKRADGTVALEYLRPDLRTLVEVAPREWPEAGFDGSWTLAYHLIEPEHLKSFAKRKGPRPGTTWYERKKDGRYVKVLWSESLHLALHLEEGREDGTRAYRMDVALAPNAKGRPWEHPSDWIRKDYTDLLD